MEEITIRKAKITEASEISTVIRQAMSQYAEDSGISIILDSLKEPPCVIEEYIRTDCIYVALKCQRIVGAVRISDCTDRSVRISRFSVLPSLQKSGVGNLLFNAAEQYIHDRNYVRAILYTATSNLYTVRFYTARGFHLTHTDPDCGYPRGTFVKIYPH